MQLKQESLNLQADWKWSSYNAHAFGKHDPILDEHSQYTELANNKESRQKHHRQMIQGYMEENDLVF